MQKDSTAMKAPSTTRRWWALGALSLAMLAVGLDATVLSVALPTLAGDLHASTADLQWFVSSYTLALAAGLLPGGLLGDRYGRKRMLLFALVIFGVGSVACAAAPSPGAFITARVLLGIGAAFAIPLSLSTLTVLFSDEERPKAIGVWAAANFLALPIGPIVGGWILTSYWWGWVFLMNIPVVIVGLGAVALLLPESRSAERPRVDYAGILTSTAGLAILAYGFVRAGQDGWGATGALAAIAAGALILVSFALWERRLDGGASRQPLIDLSLFRSTSFTWGTILAFVAGFAMFGILFALPQYFQGVRGNDALGSGLRLVPLVAGLVVGVAVASTAARLLGSKVTVAMGFAILAGAIGLGTATQVATGDAFTATWTAGAGVGMGLVMVTATSGALAALSQERAGVGSAVMQAVQKVGAPLSAAILGSVLNSGYRAGLHLDGFPAPVADAARSSVFAGVTVAGQIGSAPLLGSVRDAFVSGIDAMLWVGVAIAAVGAVLTVIFLPQRVTTSTEPRAERDEKDIAA